MLRATQAFLLVFGLGIILAACASAQPASIQPAPGQSTPIQPATSQPTPLPPTQSQPTSGQLDMPNPASVYCEEQGGRLEIRTDASGAQAGVCLFEDGSQCDEWAFFRGECQPGPTGSPGLPASEPGYVNDIYGFSFDPPSEWSVEEKQVSNDEAMGEYLVFRRPGYSMFVGYQWADEAFRPFRTGMPQGDFVDGGATTLLGQPVPKQILVWDGKNKVIAYGGRIKMGDLILVMYLDAVETPDAGYDALNIPPEVIAEADQIIASFALLSGETPQLEFNPQPPGE
jgi:putative hemolysin